MQAACTLLCRAKPDSGCARTDSIPRETPGGDTLIVLYQVSYQASFASLRGNTLHGCCLEDYRGRILPRLIEGAALLCIGDKLILTVLCGSRRAVPSSPKMTPGQ